MDYVQVSLEIPINDFDMSTAQGRTDFYIFMEQKLFTEGINQFIIGDKMHFNFDVNSENRQHVARILDND